MVKTIAISRADSENEQSHRTTSTSDHVSDLLLVLGAVSDRSFTSTHKMQAERARELSVTDASSFSNPHEFKPTHIAIEWTVDFDKSVLVGAVTLDFEVVATAPTLVLDTRELAISTIDFLDENGGRVSASWSVRAGDSELGNALDVTVPPALLRTKQTLHCRVEYSTSPTQPRRSGCQVRRRRAARTRTSSPSVRRYTRDRCCRAWTLPGPR